MCIHPPQLSYEAARPCGVWRQPYSLILTIVVAPSSGTKFISTVVL